jgi:glycosyltransferase involved in cell wall biosynthesis
MTDSQNKEPLVSICIPVYNADKTIEDTLNSILEQSYENLEILVVDNASQDHTPEIIAGFKDSRIKRYRNPTNIGGERNWNRCIELASGKYIAIFHADDIYRPTMIEKQVRIMEKNPFVGAVFTKSYHINEDNEVIGVHNFPNDLSNKNSYNFEEVFLSIMGSFNFLMCPSAMLRGTVYKELAPFNYERFGTSADLDMWFRVLERYTIAVLDEKLMCYRISKSQGTYAINRFRTSEADYFKVMDFYLAKKFKIEEIPKSIINNYELQKMRDKRNCAMSYLYKGQPTEGRTLLYREFFSLDAIIYLMKKIPRIRYLSLWVYASFLLCMSYFDPRTRDRGLRMASSLFPVGIE